MNLRKLVEHAARFAGLPLTAVPSAAVSDKQIEDSYARDLDAEKPKPATDGEVA